MRRRGRNRFRTGRGTMRQRERHAMAYQVLLPCEAATCQSTRPHVVARAPKDLQPGQHERA